MATDFHGGGGGGGDGDQISRELDLRPNYIGVKASQMKFKDFSWPPMQFKAFLRQPSKFKAFSRLYEPCEVQLISNKTLTTRNCNVLQASIYKGIPVNNSFIMEIL